MTGGSFNSGAVIVPSPTVRTDSVAACDGAGTVRPDMKFPVPFSPRTPKPFLPGWLRLPALACAGVLLLLNAGCLTKPIGAEKVSTRAAYRQVEEAEAKGILEVDAIPGSKWVPLGPSPSSGYSGRVSAIAVHPTTSSTVYVGGASGGVWKTTDEGATKLVRVHVTGAKTDAEARTAARAVATSQLTKCSWYGKDPYWGRVLSELGVSGAMFDPERVTIAYDDVVVCEHGIAAPHDAVAVATAMEQRDLVLDCDLHNGNGEATMVFTDLTHAYVDENMGTS